MEEEILETPVPENNPETDVGTENDKQTEDITDPVDSENNKNNNENTDTSNGNSDVITDQEQGNTDNVETPVENSPDDTTGTNPEDNNNNETTGTDNPENNPEGTNNTETSVENNSEDTNSTDNTTNPDNSENDNKTDDTETPVENNPDGTTGTDSVENNNDEIGNESTGNEQKDPPVSVQEPKNVKVTYTSLAWVNKDMQILHAVDLTIDGENYGSQLIPITSCIGQTIVRYMTDNDIIIPIEAENLEDETELSDERLFVIVQENIQAYMDTFAHTRDYDNAIYCISYGSSTVPRFKNEAKRMMVYRDLCWAIGNDFVFKYRSGERDRPTLEEVMKALPVLSWEGPIIGLDGKEIDLDAL